MPNNSKSIFLDFDGTLIDSRERLYTLFQELAPQSKLSFDEYWDIKRTRVDQQKLLRKNFLYTEDQIANFKEQWRSKVEEAQRLMQDKPLAGVSEFLTRLNREGYHLHLVTARKNAELVEMQLKRFDWRQYFNHVLVSCQSESKENLVRRTVCFTPDDIFVGDTGEDVQTAKALGIKSIAVTSGILSAEVLKDYTPDFICESLVNIYESGLL